MTASGNTVNLYRVSDGSLLRSLSVGSGSLFSFAVSPDGIHIATGTADGHITLWRISDGTPLLTWAGHIGRVDSLAFSPDGQLLASGSGRSLNTIDNTLRIWGVSDGQQKLLTIGPNPSYDYYGDVYYKVSFSPDSSQLAIGAIGGQQSVSVYSTSTGALLRSFSVYSQAGSLSFIAISPDWQTVATCDGYYNSLVHLFHLSDGTPLQQIFLAAGPYSVNFSPDGKAIVIGGFDIDDTGPVLSTWRVSDGIELQEPATLGAGGRIRSIAISPDGQTMASWIRGHGSLVLRHLSDGSPIRAFPYQPNGFAFSPDGSLLAVSYVANDLSSTHIAFWRVSDGTIVRDEITGNGHGLAFSPDGQLLAVSDGSIYRVSDGTLVKSLGVGAGGGVGDDRTVAFLPDGTKFVIESGDNGIHVYQVSDWSLAFSFDFQSTVQSLAFSPDSQWLAVGTSSDGIYQFRTSDGKLIRSLPSNSGISSVAFSPDGQILLTGSYDAHLTFWMVSDGSLVQYYDQETGSPGSSFTGGVQSVGYSPDGRYVLYGRNDGTVAAALNPYRNAIFPTKGGNTGNVTVKVITPDTFPVADGTTVVLTAPGQQDIVFIATQVINPHVLSATFDLTNAPLGLRDVVITSSDSGTQIYPQNFTIEQGIPPDLHIDVVGRKAVLVGTTSILAMSNAV